MNLQEANQGGTVYDLIADLAKSNSFNWRAGHTNAVKIIVIMIVNKNQNYQAKTCASSQATVFESVFYSLHTVAAWACLTSIAWIYYDQMATWNNSSWYSEAILIQWNDTFYKPFGLNDKQRYAAHARITRLFYRSTVSCPVV